MPTSGKPKSFLLYPEGRPDLGGGRLRQRGVQGEGPPGVHEHRVARRRAPQGDARPLHLGGVVTQFCIVAKVVINPNPHKVYEVALWVHHPCVSLKSCILLLE